LKKVSLTTFSRKMSQVSETSVRPGALDVGSVATLVHVVTENDVEAFASLSGDRNPLHMDGAFARRAGFRGRVVHGVITAALVSNVIGMQLPGAGSLWARQEFEWLEPVFIGDRLEVVVTVLSKSEGTRTIAVKVEVRNQGGRIVMQGNGVVRLPDLTEDVRAVPLNERSVMITGGSSALGRALARTFDEAGAKVILLYSEGSTEESSAVREAANAGKNIVAMKCVATHAGSLASSVERAHQLFGRPVDVLVHNGNAGFTPSAFSALSWSEIESQLDAQLKSAFHASQAVLPGMLKSGSGAIVYVSSSASWGTPPAQWTPYTIAAAALQAFARSLAAELGPKRIRVNSVSAGMQDGGVFAAVPERMRKLQAMQTPLRRLVSNEDLCSTVRFLCSEGAEFITGADIPVCGGFAM